jgi:hypothetical protein
MGGSARREIVVIAEVLAGVLAVAAQIEVGPVVDALGLVPSERILELDVDRFRRVVRSFILRVFAEPQDGVRDPQVGVPLPASREPLVEEARRVIGTAEVLHLHLLELARAKDEVPRRDLVPEGLTDLRDPERQPSPRRLLDVLEVDEDPLRRLRTQPRDRRGVLRRADDVLNMRLNRRGSASFFSPQFGQATLVRSILFDRQASMSWSPCGSSSMRYRFLQLRHSTSGSVKFSTCPEASQTFGCMRMAASRPTMSSRSWTMARHHARFTLFLSSTPSGP